MVQLSLRRLGAGHRRGRIEHTGLSTEATSALLLLLSARTEARWILTAHAAAEGCEHGVLMCTDANPQSPTPLPARSAKRASKKPFACEFSSFTVAQPFGSRLSLVPKRGHLRALEHLPLDTVLCDARQSDHPSRRPVARHGKRECCTQGRKQREREIKKRRSAG